MRSVQEQQELQISHTNVVLSIGQQHIEVWGIQQNQDYSFLIVKRMCVNVEDFLISIAQTKPKSSSLGRNHKNIIRLVLLLGAGRTTHELEWSSQI